MKKFRCFTLLCTLIFFMVWGVINGDSPFSVFGLSFSFIGLLFSLALPIKNTENKKVKLRDRLPIKIASDDFTIYLLMLALSAILIIFPIEYTLDYYVENTQLWTVLSFVFLIFLFLGFPIFTWFKKWWIIDDTTKEITEKENTGNEDAYILHSHSDSPVNILFKELSIDGNHAVFKDKDGNTITLKLNEDDIVKLNMIFAKTDVGMSFNELSKHVNDTIKGENDDK